MNWTPEERETVVNASDGDDVVRIWTAQRRYITRLRKNPAFTETIVGEGFSEFTIPADMWNPASGAKRSRILSEQERIEVGKRLQRGRDRASK